MKKKALIFGVTGQDGSYLAELLISKKYEVHCLIRRSSTGNTKNIENIIDKLIIHKGDLADTTSLYRVISNVQPDELYNEADQDHVSWSYDTVDYSCDITGSAVARILEIIKQVNPKIKFFQPLSSNIFGKAKKSPQNQLSNFNPQSPYAAAKIFAHSICQYYRNVFGIFVSTAIFYNHESERRTTDYVSRKITKAVANISLGYQKKLYLGNIDVKIDFGYAPEYMECAWKILQQNKPEDFIISSGETHSLKEFLEKAFKHVNLDYKKYVFIDKNLYRPSDTYELVGDYSKAKKIIGYTPNVKFHEIIKKMVDHDINLLKKK